ncbi:hypothetical protein U6G28_07090 [Actinomycetaceae bacterium MB13-C1-2]|nr:hypothetical protein U6G28_07090 [Actinomycetaceae bacterium MB13-C1-2]
MFTPLGNLTDAYVEDNMTRGQSDPAKSGSLWTMTADTQKAFEVLTLTEAKAVRFW